MCRTLVDKLLNIIHSHLLVILLGLPEGETHGPSLVDMFDKAKGYCCIGGRLF